MGFAVTGDNIGNDTNYILKTTNGGENWDEQTQHQITWNKTGTCSSVKIQYIIGFSILPLSRKPSEGGVMLCRLILYMGSDSHRKAKKLRMRLDVPLLG